jgi:hypothetical protein
MGTLRRHEGYLIIDHRYSEGVTPELVRQSGLDSPVVGKNQVYESATVTCSHCGAVVILSPTRKRPRHYCVKCDHYVCDKPECGLECNPWMKKLEQQDLLIK